MARINVNRTWYEQIEPSTFSEDEFEQRVTLHAPSVYPFYHVIPFKRSVKAPSDQSPNGYTEVIPDLIFIAKDYTDWWICEIEMGYHSFKSHVKPQVEKLLQADYGEDEVNYVCNKYDLFDRSKLLELIQTVPPRVIVIVNQHVPRWIQGWPEGKVVFAIFELFRAADGHEVFRINGDYPSYLRDKVSSCSFHPIVPRLLVIDEPEKLNLPRRALLQLLFNNCVTEWRRIDENEQIYLTSVSRNPLKANHRYSIYVRSDGQLILYREVAEESEDDE